MSFLSGITDFFSGGNVLGSIVKIAGLTYVASQITKNTNPSNQISTAPTVTPNIDAGVRLQIPPASDQKVPVLYGTAYFGGNITDAVMTNNNKTMYYCVTLCEKTGSKLSDNLESEFLFKDVYWDDQRVEFMGDGITVNYTVDRDGNIDRSLSGLVKIYCYKNGSSSQVAPENYTLTTTNNAWSIMPGWTTNHTMNELAFAIIRVDYNRDKNVTGIGNVLFQVSNSMYKPGDVLYDFMTNTRYGAGIDSGDIEPTARFLQLNAYSEISIPYTDESTNVPQTLVDSSV